MEVAGVAAAAGGRQRQQQQRAVTAGAAARWWQKHSRQPGILTSTASLLRGSAVAEPAPKRASRWLRRSALPGGAGLGGGRGAGLGFGFGVEEAAGDGRAHEPTWRLAGG